MDYFFVFVFAPFSRKTNEEEINNRVFFLFFFSIYHAASLNRYQNNNLGPVATYNLKAGPRLKQR